MNDITEISTTIRELRTQMIAFHQEWADVELALDRLDPNFGLPPESKQAPREVSDAEREAADAQRQEFHERRKRLEPQFAATLASIFDRLVALQPPTHALQPLVELLQSEFPKHVELKAAEAILVLVETHRNELTTGDKQLLAKAIAERACTTADLSGLLSQTSRLLAAPVRPN